MAEINEQISMNTDTGKIVIVEKEMTNYSSLTIFDRKTHSALCILLDGDQRKELIRMLEKME